MSKLRRRVSSAHLIALVALFVSLGGTSFAALVITGKNVKNGSLTGTDIKNNSVTGKDVKSLTGSDIKNGSIGAGDVKSDALTGTQISEGTLGKVPSSANADKATSADKATNADHATNADKATNADHATSADKATSADNTDGASFSTISYSSTSSTNTEVLNVGGLRLGASCAGGTVTVNATTSSNNARISAGRAQGVTFLNDSDFDTVDTFAVTSGNNNEISVNYRTVPSSVIFPTSHVSVQLQTMSNGTTCTVDGHAISSSTGGLIISPLRKKQ
jgi:cytoskeletal protein RodZ